MQFVLIQIFALVAISTSFPQTIAARNNQQPTQDAAVLKATEAPLPTSPEGEKKQPATSSDPAKAESTSSPQSGQPERRKPAERGGLSRGLPPWMTVSVQNRGRVESTAVMASGSKRDGYYLNRVRLEASLKPTGWLQITIQGQDSEVLGYNFSPAPKAVRNPLDLRLGAVEVAGRGTSARIGRQALVFGDGSVIGTSDWAGTNKTYDAARLSFASSGKKVDVFVARPVDINNRGFDRPRPGEYFSGAWVSLSNATNRTTIDPFIIVKNVANGVGETGSRGATAIWTTGWHLVGKSGQSASYTADVMLQRGHVASDPVSAWAWRAGFAWTASHVAWSPRVGIDYRFASGDSNPRDGRRQTFDQLYASLHGVFGLLDSVGWRNVRDLTLTAEMLPVKKLKVNYAVHRLQIADANDSVYGGSGAAVIAARRGTSSRDVGTEVDCYATISLSRQVSIGAGLGVLAAGTLVRQSTSESMFWTPYVLWNVKF